MTSHQEEAQAKYCISMSTVPFLQVTYLNVCNTSWGTGFSTDISLLASS